MGGALDGFRDSLKGIDRFSANASLAGSGLDDEAAVKTDAATELRVRASQRGLPPEVRDALLEEAGERETEAQKLRLDRTQWEREVLHVWVLRLVTAFEVFLRDLIIEKASTDEGLVRRFLAGHDGLEVDGPLLLGPATEAPERIAGCVDKTCETFSNLTQVNNYFTNWFGAGQGFLGIGRLAPPLDTRATKSDAVADVRILLQLRHILVHKSGVPNGNYHRELAGPQCGSRLDASVCDLSAERAAPPDAVLASPARYPGNPAKKDDLYQSLLMLAEHVDALYT